MVIGGQRVQTNEKFWTNIQELSGTVHLYVLLTSLLVPHSMVPVLFSGYRYHQRFF